MTNLPDEAHERPLLDEKELEAISLALMQSSEGDVLVAHQRGCLVRLGLGACNCRPRIFVVPFTKGYLS